jgi:hypothetical protein
LLLIAFIFLLLPVMLWLPTGRAKATKLTGGSLEKYGLSRYKSLGSSMHDDPSVVASTIFQENFDAVTAPALPAGWTTDVSGSGILWTTSNTSPDTAPNDAFGPESAAVGLTNLKSPTIAVPATGTAQLRFRNRYNLEHDSGTGIGFDGMVLEISINGGAFADILAGGGSFVTGGYNAAISSDFGSPLAGRMAWTGLSSGSTAAPTYITTVVNLPAAANGQNIQLRWRVGSDESNVAPGLAGARIDTITLVIPPILACAQNEGFDNITTLAGAGWVQINRSNPVGTFGWFQGNTDPSLGSQFPSQSGATNSYIAADFNNTTGDHTISNWLLTPAQTLHNGDQLIFYTRTVSPPDFADRLQVRMSLNGASTDVGTTETSVGDFTTLLLDINPTYTLTDYPSDWTQFTLTLSGIGVPTTGRLAFRYFVENGGPDGANSSYIGIDTVQFPCGAPTPTPTPSPGSPTVQFSASAASVSETLDATTSLDLTVTRTGDISGAATIDYASLDGTASERSDYLAALGTLHFAAGENSKTITVFIVDDRFGETPETFTVNLSNPIGCALGSQTTFTVTINSNELVDGLNPVKDASFNTDFFVREHYVDFFNRAADPSGLAFWKNQIDECTTQACSEIRRINVSAAFFLSIEFQQTGYLVYRTYQAAFNSGEFLKLRNFLPDTQEIGRGVVIGQPGADALLEANKQRFFIDFVQRAAFLAPTAFPTSMTAAQFVDKLNANTFDPQNPGAGALTQSERDALVAQLSPDPTSPTLRAQVLRSVAENGVFFARQFNKAFVLMQYFGYLRRNPNDPPEAGLDFAGYNFWLGKLNQFNGNFVNADMVKAFITSGEYEQRFGP